MTEAQVTEARAAITPIADQLLELEHMSFKDLRHRWHEVFGEHARSNNRDSLRRRIAYRIQELAEGGLSEEAKARLVELSQGMPLRLSAMPEEGVGEPEMPEEPGQPGPATVIELVTQPATPQPRDPRLPPPGTLLKKTYKGEVHEVVVQEHCFEYRGKSYRSLSALAKKIAGCAWNGYTFFALKPEDRSDA